MRKLKSGLIALALALFASAFPGLLEAQTCKPSVRQQVTVLEAVEQRPSVILVTLTADRSTRPTNLLSQVRFTTVQNARVEAGGQLFGVGAVIPFFPPQETWTFVVRRNSSGAFLANFVVADACGEVKKFVGHGGAVAAPGTVPPTPPLPGANPPLCSQALHDSIVVRGPDGNVYPTWHPPIDPATGCSFGHEHGADPRGSLANGSMPPFGYVTAVAGQPTEPHEGFKVFIVHAGTRYEQKVAPADMRLVFHMGTSRIGRYGTRFHSMIFDYVARDGSGRYAHVTGMADTTDRVGSTCVRPRSGGRDFSTVGCDDPYEIWSFRFQIVHPDDPPNLGEDQVRFTGAGSVAAFDPITTRDPSDSGRLIYTEQYRNGIAASDPLSPFAQFRGCQRESYMEATWNNANGRPTVYWTDAAGQVNRGGEAPGLIRQEVGVAPRGKIDVYKYRKDFCAPGVRAPN